MPTLPVKAAAYTRTGVLKRFLEQLTAAVPARVDNAYAESRLGLKGGDIRAFLQSVRVLGIVDPYGIVTERGRRMRASGHRGAAMREGLEGAYPELVNRWDLYGGMNREQIEDFFKIEYGLSVSSAGPASKLFADLMREYGRRDASRLHEPPRQETDASRPAKAIRSAPSERRSAPDREAPPDVQFAALETIRSSLNIQINAEWDERRIELVFDRMERLVERILDGRYDLSGG